MLRKNKTLSAFAAALLASATAMQPVAAQGNETWYAQGGYNENAPYANYPNDGSTSTAPYDQGYGGQSFEGTYSGSTPDEDYERERAAEEWRAQYQTGAPAQPYQSYTPPANQDYYAQSDQGYYAQSDQGYYDQGNVGQGYYDQGYADQGYYPRDDYYSASDHYAYRRECERQRANNQVGGLVFGAIAGGLFGNAIAGRHNRGGATAMGMIMGGALGAGIAGNMDCDDRYYFHQTYYDGFERGYSNRTYQWRNPNTGHHGAFRVGDYYQGPRGQRCATYAQTIWIQGRPERARGYACRRGDGSWEIIS